MNLKPHQVDLIITSGPVRDEFAQKVKELDRRLKMNGMDYKQWDTLTDHQHEIFTDNLFLDGECAASPENYVRGAVDSCWCPDVVEDLHHHSPVLMREIEKQQEMTPDMTVKISESLGFLNEMIDKELEILLVDSLLTEKKKSASQLYEEKVIDAMKESQLESGMFTQKVVDASSTGPDAQFYIPGSKGGKYFLEIKLNEKAQMGDSSVYYNPNGNGTFRVGARIQSDGTLKGGKVVNGGLKGKFGLAKPKMFTPEMKEKIYAVLEEKESDILAWIEALKDDRRIVSYEWENDSQLNALFKTTYEKYQEARSSGLLTQAGAGYGGAETITIGQEAINQIYNSKGIYYIQIGGKGLYYMGSNPANLPIKEMKAEVNMELRPRPSSRDKADVRTEKFKKMGFTKEPQVDEKGRLKYVLVNGKKIEYVAGKGHIKGPGGFAVMPVHKTPTDDAANSPEPYVGYGGVYSIIPRLAANLEESPYTFDQVDGPRGILAMFEKMDVRPLDKLASFDISVDDENEDDKKEKDQPSKDDIALRVQKMMGIGNRDDQ